MTETKPNPAARPLPRFQPRTPNKQQIPRTMTSSVSMPNLKNYKETSKHKKEERTPQRKERKDERTAKRIDFGAIKAPRKNVETYNAVIIPKSKTEIFDTHLDDIIEGDGNLAITLPLVPSQKNIPSAADILNTKDEKVMLVQLPSALPIQYPNDSAQMEYNPLFSAADGHIGKLYIHKSGKVTAKIGNIVLDVSSGIAPSCNDIMCVRREKGIDYFPVPGEKLKFSVDIDALLNSK